MQKFIKISRYFILFFLSFTFVACSQKTAPIVNRGHIVYDRAASKYKNYSKRNYNKSATIIVAKGDTVYSIARDNNVPIRDIINSNDLEAPYILKVGDEIKLPSSQYHKVVAGDTLYGISRQYDMNVNNLIASNNLQEPYTIKVGDRLRISNQKPSSTRFKTRSVAYKKAKRPQNVTSKNLSDIKIASKNNKFIWPAKGRVISKFGAKAGGLYNDGINIKAKAGDDVRAVEDGVVAYVGNELRGYGNLVIVKHSDGWISAYAHLDNTKVKRGQKVSKGKLIASVGSTGNVKTPQLYFGLRKGRQAVNPQRYL